MDLLEDIERLAFLRALEPWFWLAIFVTAAVTGTRLSSAGHRTGAAWLLTGALLAIAANRFVVSEIPLALRARGSFEAAGQLAAGAFWCAHVPALLAVAVALLLFRPGTAVPAAERAADASSAPSSGTSSRGDA